MTHLEPEAREAAVVHIIESMVEAMMHIVRY